MSQPKPLAEGDLKKADFCFREFVLEIDLKLTPLESLFRSSFWQKSPQIKQLVRGDIVRVRSVCGSLDTLLTISAKTGDRITVTRWPKIPPQIRDAEAKAAPKQIEKKGDETHA
jgi:hypothetical protein